MTMHRIGWLVLVLLVAGCREELALLSERGDAPARAATRAANEQIVAANAAIRSRAPRGELEVFADTLDRRIEAFNEGTSDPDLALVATLGHAAAVLSRALGDGPDHPADAAVAHFARRVGEHPAGWSTEVEQLARVLELEGTGLSRRVAAEVRARRAQLESDAAAIDDPPGTARTCTAGGAAEPIAVVAGRLFASILSTLRPSTSADWLAAFSQPAVCTAEPPRVVLSRGAPTGPLVSPSPLTVFGLNLRAPPNAEVQDAGGQATPIALAPVVRGSARIDVPLQGVDFSAAPTGRILLSFQGGAPPELAIPLVTGVKAEFDATPRDGSAPLTVAFTDRSAGSPTGWSWTFGDGTTSAEQHPRHLYARPGTYEVRLAVRRPESADTAARPAFVTIRAPPLRTTIVPPMVPSPAPVSVTFRHETSRAPASVCWGFGDGPATVCQPSPSHLYRSAGTYLVTLHVRDEFGSEASAATTVVVAAPPLRAAFAPSPASGACPLTAWLRNTSQRPPGTAWEWRFSDGGVATSQDVTHVFRRPGSHSVTLLASHQGRQSSVTSTVTVRPPPPVHHYVQTFTGSGGLLGSNRDLVLASPNCGPGFRRHTCTATRIGNTNANCGARWTEPNDVHDCRCTVHLGIHSGASLRCDVVIEKVDEACAE